MHAFNHAVLFSIVVYPLTTCPLGFRSPWENSKQSFKTHTRNRYNEYTSADYYVDVNLKLSLTSNNYLGDYYRLCLDIDGADGPSTYGDAGELYYISPVRLSTEPMVKKASLQTVQVYCPSCRPLEYSCINETDTV